jgi:pyruvate dehydrogenase (quinone)
VGGLDGALGRQDVKKAAEILNKGEKIAMLVAAHHATDEVIAVANRLNAGVAKALL